MKKIIGILAFVMIFVAGASVSAQATSFDVSLSYGSTNTAEVLKLQQFLFDNGYLSVSPTGNYLGLTQKAVANFQAANGISPSAGYFGPLTRAAVNSKIAGAGTPASTLSVNGVRSTNSNSATAILANERVVTWTSNSYPSNAGVNINLLRKSVTTPTTFTLIRTVSANTANDGSETFVVQNSETGSDVYTEVTCSNTYQFQNGCSFSGAPAKVN